MTNDLFESTNGYTPCPRVVVDILGTLVKPMDAGGQLLDNCAGDGFAALKLCNEWHLKPFLVEPHGKRARECAKIPNAVVLNSRAEDLEIIGAPHVFYCNPPYDPDDPKGTMEYSILEYSFHHLVKEGTLCILILPERSLKCGWMIQMIVRLRNVRVRRFPNRCYMLTKQIIVFGYVSSFAHATSALHRRLLPCQDMSFCALKPHEFCYTIRGKVSGIRSIKCKNYVKS